MTAARVREFVLWAVGLTLLYLLLISKVTVPETVVGVGIAALAAAATVAARAAAASQQRLPVQALGWLVHLPVAVVRDTLAVWVAAARRERGSWRHLELAGTAGDDPRAAGRRAGAALVLTSTPGSIVVDIDPATGRALLHDLGGGRGSRLERAVAG